MFVWKYIIDFFLSYPYIYVFCFRLTLALSLVAHIIPASLSQHERDFILYCVVLKDVDIGDELLD